MAKNTSPRQQYCGSTEASWYPVTLTAGSNVAIVAHPLYQIKVYAVFLGAASSVNITFEDGSTPFSGAMPMTGLAFDTEDKPMICSVGNDFVIVSTGNAAGMVFASIN
jgi:hypothetical protein